MRKNKKVVSLNPEYGIEVTTLTQIADKVKNDNRRIVYNSYYINRKYFSR